MKGGRNEWVLQAVGLTVSQDLHNVVAVPLVHELALKVLIPVPQLDRHVIRARDDEGQRGVDREVAEVVRVRLPRLDLFHRVVVEDADHEVVRARYDPLLARDELGGADGELRDLKCLKKRLGRVVPQVHIAIVQTGRGGGEERG